VGALNQSMSIIIRSRGGYVFSQLVNTLNGDIIGVIGIFLYIYAGATPYLIFIAMGTIPVMFVYVSYLRKLFRCRFILIQPTITKIKQTRYLWLKSYLDYFRNEADSLLVSLLFPPVIMGSYSIYKRFEGIFKQFIEGFFDVLCQRQVQNKGEIEILKAQERKINFVRWAAIFIILGGGVIFSIIPDFFISLINLTKYDNIQIIVYTVMGVAILYLVGKYEINAISYFAPSKTIWKMGIIVFVITIASYFVLFLLPSIQGALLQRVISWGAATVIAIILFRPRRDVYYKNIFK
jgi:O-antigen/teichoic acid export membrane protein